MRIVICDDHQLLLEALASALAQRGYVIEAAVTTTADAVQSVSRHDPDLLLIDLMFPAADGLEAARRVLAQHPRTKVVIITGSDSMEPLVEALEIGVHGYTRKDRPIPEIAAVIDAAAGGQLAVDRNMLQRLKRPFDLVPRQRAATVELTPRERSVADLLVNGLNTDQIMVRLGVSQSTVRTHVQNILSKLGVHSRLQAVALLSEQDPFMVADGRHATAS